MRIARLVAAVAAATTALTGLGVLAATSASAADHGPLLPGNIYLLNSRTIAGLAAATPANQKTSGTYNALEWVNTTIATDGTLPEGAAGLQFNVQLRTAAPEANWEETTLINTKAVLLDANGDPYLQGPISSPGTGNATLQQFLAANPGTTSLPAVLIVTTAGGAQLGHFTTEIHFDANTTSTGTWHSSTRPHSR